MRAGGGKQKGAAFERETCKRLSLWISNYQREDLFWRSAMSGGRSTVAQTKGKRLAQQAGDISAIDPMGQPFIDRFLIECKHYRDLDLRGLFTLKGKLVEFWHAAHEQAVEYGKAPLLIAKQNNLPAFVCSYLNGVGYFWGHPILVSYPLMLEIRWFDAILTYKPLQ